MITIPDPPETPSGLRELDIVALTAPASTDEGHEMPIGAEGTIVGIHGDGEAFCVEFTEPVAGLADVAASDLRLVWRSGCDPEGRS